MSSTIRGRRAVAFAVWVLTAAAVCAATTYDVEEIRAADEALYREWSAMEWDNAVFGKEADLGALLKKYSFLSDDPALLDYISAQERAAPNAAEARRLSYLYRDLATTYEAKRVADIEDDIQNHYAGDHVWVPHLQEAVPVRNLYPLMRRTDDEGPFKELWYAADNYAINVINPLRRERLKRHHETTRAMGYESYADFYYKVLGYKPGVPAAQARKFRDETFPMYKELITARCRALFGKDPADTPPWQSKNLWFGKEFDKYFPQENFLPFTYNFFATLGLDIRALPNVTVDDADRPEKEPRAACFPFEVPRDVRVNLKPVGGAEDYETALHEFGHALHAAFTDPTLPFEFRALGSNELTETYAIFFQSTFSDRTFVAEEVGMPAEVLDDYLRYKLATDLGAARSTAFDVIYDEILHSGKFTDEELLARYEEEVDRQRLFPKYRISLEADYLNVDEGFYALYYMAAYYAAAQLKVAVTERFGPRWYKDPAAGEFFRDLFRHGDSWTVDEMLRYVGFEEGLNPEYLIADFKARYEELKK